MTASRSLSAKISVGIGSWADPEYTGLLFPKGIKSDARLPVYATRFDHVEVNSSYYVIPTAEKTARWAELTPAGFVFDIKLHKAFSQSPEKSVREGQLVPRLLESMQPLIDARKLGTFFSTMPPSFGPEKSRLEVLDSLVESLQPHLLAIELRHSGWVEDEQRDRTLEYFRTRKLVWIAVDMPHVEDSTLMPPVDEVTNPRLAHLRLHGRRSDWLELKDQGERHAYEYSPKELKEIAARVRLLAEKAETVHVVANNHANDFAPKTAIALQQLLGIARKSAAPENPDGA